MIEFPLALTSIQKGRVAELLVAYALLVASNGRLSPFVPFVDDHGVDLIMLDKFTRRSLALQVKSAIASPQFDVRKATYNGEAGDYLLLLRFDPARLALTASWLIPMAAVPEVATAQSEKFALRPGLKAGPAPYRYDDAHGLAAAVQQAMEGRAHAAATADRRHPP